MRQQTYYALWGFLMMMMGAMPLPTLATNDFDALPAAVLVNDTLPNPTPCQLGLPILDDDCSGNQEFPILVTTAPGTALGTDVYLKEVRLIIRHFWDLDLDIFLISPSGKVVTLSTDNGDTGDHYGDPDDGTCGRYTAFLSPISPDACQAISITDGQAPFIGSYLPEGSLTGFDDQATNPNGVWILKVCDDAAANVGTLEYAELVFDAMVCVPPSQVEVIALDSNQVTLDWTPGNFCNNSIVEYGSTPGFMPGTGSMVGEGDAAPATLCPPVTLTNLMPNTTYELYVREFCGGGQFSANSCPIRFTTKCSPPPPTLTESFDSLALCPAVCGAPCGISGVWHNATLDGFDWTVHRGSTLTSQTGPDDDALGGGQYIYLETSGGECQNSEAHLVSDCLEVHAGADSCDLSFFYHLFGNNFSMNLALDLSTDGGQNWTRLWSVSGNKGNTWHRKYIDLSPWDGQVVQLRFVGKTGGGAYSDLALDHIQFYGTTSLGPGTEVYYVDNDGDGYGRSDQFFQTCYPGTWPGFSTVAGDCDDNNAFVNPGAPETPCDFFDINCNGNADEFVLSPPAISEDTMRVCDGEVPVLTATPQFFGEIYWFDQPTGGDVLFQGENFSPADLPSPDSPMPVYRNFYAEERNPMGCTSSDRAVVTVAIFPVPDLMTSDEINLCGGQMFDLAVLNIVDQNGAGGQFSYYKNSIAPQNQLASSVIHPFTTTTYFIVSTNDIGCSGAIAVSAQVSKGPQAYIFGDSTLCPTTATTLTALNIGNDDPSLSFKWNTGSTTNKTIAYAGNAIGQSRIYSVSITASDGCVGVDSFEVKTIGSIASATTSTTSVSTCDGNDGAIQITVSGGVFPIQYQWSGPGGSTGSGTAGSGNFVISGLKQGSYDLTLTDQSAEACPFEIKPVLVNGPFVLIKEPQITAPTCFNDDNGTIFLDVIGNNFSLFWNTGDTTEMLTGLSAGNYK
ncbi:MAG: hypothetical protein D6714_03950, partial [Bacteroidetes bacterium]